MISWILVNIGSGNDQTISWTTVNWSSFRQWELGKMKLNSKVKQKFIKQNYKMHLNVLSTKCLPFLQVFMWLSLDPSDAIQGLFQYGPSQWEMVLQCNSVCHWLGAYTEWSLAIWCPGFGSTLVQVMACCLMGQSFYPNQHFFNFINKVVWNSCKGNLAGLLLWDIIS